MANEFQDALNKVQGINLPTDTNPVNTSLGMSPPTKQEKLANKSIEKQAKIGQIAGGLAPGNIRIPAENITVKDGDTLHYTDPSFADKQKLRFQDIFSAETSKPFVDMTKGSQYNDQRYLIAKSMNIPIDSVTEEMINAVGIQQQKELEAGIQNQGYLDVAKDKEGLPSTYGRTVEPSTLPQEVQNRTNLDPSGLGFNNNPTFIDDAITKYHKKDPKNPNSISDYEARKSGQYGKRVASGTASVIEKAKSAEDNIRNVTVLKENEVTPTDVKLGDSIQEKKKNVTAQLKLLGLKNKNVSGTEFVEYQETKKKLLDKALSKEEKAFLKEGPRTLKESSFLTKAGDLIDRITSDYSGERTTEKATLSPSSAYNQYIATSKTVKENKDVAAEVGKDINRSEETVLQLKLKGHADKILKAKDITSVVSGTVDLIAGGLDFGVGSKMLAESLPQMVASGSAIGGATVFATVTADQMKEQTDAFRKAHNGTYPTPDQQNVIAATSVGVGLLQLGSDRVALGGLKFGKGIFKSDKELATVFKKLQPETKKEMGRLAKAANKPVLKFFGSVAVHFGKQYANEAFDEAGESVLGDIGAGAGVDGSKALVGGALGGGAGVVGAVTLPIAGIAIGGGKAAVTGAINKAEKRGVNKAVKSTRDNLTKGFVNDSETSASGTELDIAANILNNIQQHEAPKGFNQIYGKNKSAPLDKMTAQQVLDMQTDPKLRWDKRSNAVGGYQIMGFNVAKAIESGLVKKDEKFTAEVQSRIAYNLIKEDTEKFAKAVEDYDKDTSEYKDARAEYALKLARTWAYLPVMEDTTREIKNKEGKVIERRLIPAGQSYYWAGGKNDLNKSLVTIADFDKLLTGSAEGLTAKTINALGNGLGKLGKGAVSSVSGFFEKDDLKGFTEAVAPEQELDTIVDENSPQQPKVTTAKPNPPEDDLGTELIRYSEEEGEVVPLPKLKKFITNPEHTQEYLGEKVIELLLHPVTQEEARKDPKFAAKVRTRAETATNHIKTLPKEDIEELSEEYDFLYDLVKNNGISTYSQEELKAKQDRTFPEDKPILDRQVDQIKADPAVFIKYGSMDTEGNMGADDVENVKKVRKIFKDIISDPNISDDDKNIVTAIQRLSNKARVRTKKSPGLAKTSADVYGNVNEFNHRGLPAYIKDTVHAMTDATRTKSERKAATKGLNDDLYAWRGHHKEKLAQLLKGMNTVKQTGKSETIALGSSTFKISPTTKGFGAAKGLFREIESELESLNTTIDLLSGLESKLLNDGGLSTKQEQALSDLTPKAAKQVLPTIKAKEAKASKLIEDKAKAGEANLKVKEAVKAIETYSDLAERIDSLPNNYDVTEIFNRIRANSKVTPENLKVVTEIIAKIKARKGDIKQGSENSDDTLLNSLEDMLAEMEVELENAKDSEVTADTKAAISKLKKKIKATNKSLVDDLKSKDEAIVAANSKYAEEEAELELKAADLTADILDGFDLSDNDLETLSEVDGILESSSNKNLASIPSMTVRKLAVISMRDQLDSEMRSLSTEVDALNTEISHNPLLDKKKRTNKAKAVEKLTKKYKKLEAKLYKLDSMIAAMSLTDQSITYNEKTRKIDDTNITYDTWHDPKTASSDSGWKGFKVPSFNIGQMLEPKITKSSSVLAREPNFFIKWEDDKNSLIQKHSISDTDVAAIDHIYEEIIKEEDGTSFSRENESIYDTAKSSDGSTILNRLWNNPLLAFADKDGRLPRNLLHAITIESYQFMATDIKGLAGDSDANIMGMFNLSDPKEITDNMRHIGNKLGVLPDLVQRKMGRNILNALGLTINEDVDGIWEEKIILSLGAAALFPLTAVSKDANELNMLELNSMSAANLKAYGKKSITDQQAKSNAQFKYLNVPLRNGKYEFHPQIQAIHDTVNENKELFEDIRTVFSSKSTVNIPTNKPARANKRIKGNDSVASNTLHEATQAFNDQKWAAIGAHTEFLDKVDDDFIAEMQGEDQRIAGKSDDELVALYTGADDNVDLPHIDSIDSVQGSNLGIRRGVNLLKEFLKDHGNNGFHISHRVWKSLRIGDNGSTISPQNNKLHRAIFGLGDYKSTLNPQDSKHMTGFNLALEEALGVTTEEVFDKSNDNYKDTADIRKAIKIIGKSKYTKANKATLLKALGGSKMAGMVGIIALSKYAEAKESETSFETHLTLEVDGITNGIISGLLQLPTQDVTDGSDAAQAYIDSVGAGGIFFTTSKYKSLAERKNANLDDNYKKIAATLHKLLSEQFNGPQEKPIVDALVHLLLEGDGFIDKNGKVTKAGRDMAKYPLMISGYSASDLRIIGEQLNTTIDNVGALLDEHQNDTTSLKILNDHLKVLNDTLVGVGSVNKVFPDLFTKDGKLISKYGDTGFLKVSIKDILTNNPDINKNLRELFNKTIGSNLTKGIDTNFGASKVGIDFINQSNSVVNAIFVSEYKYRTGKRQEELNVEILPKVERDAILSDLIDEGLMPGFRHATSETLTEHTQYTESRPVPLDGTSKMQFHLNENVRFGGTEIGVSNGSFEETFRKTKSNISIPYIEEFSAKGSVKPYVGSILSTDANTVAMTMTQKKTELLGLFDAFNGGIEQMLNTDVVERTNTNFKDIAVNWSNYEAAGEKLTNAISHFNSLSPARRKEVQAILGDGLTKLQKDKYKGVHDSQTFLRSSYPPATVNDEANPNFTLLTPSQQEKATASITKNSFTLKDFINEFNEHGEFIKSNREALKDNLESVQQHDIGINDTAYQAKETITDTGLKATIDTEFAILQSTEAVPTISKDRISILHGSSKKAKEGEFDVVDFLNSQRIQKSNVSDVFEKFGTAFGRSNSTHSNYLNNLVRKTITPFFTNEEELNLHVSKTHNGTSGGVTFSGDIVVKVNSSNKAFTNLDMSAEEVLAHELTHPVWEYAIKNIPAIRNEIKRLFKNAKDKVTYEDFLTKDQNGNIVYLISKDAEIEAAKAKYDYIFSTDPNEYLHEFATFAATNQQFREILAKKVTNKVEVAIDKKPYQMGFIEAIEYYYDKATAFVLGLAFGNGRKVKRAINVSGDKSIDNMLARIVQAKETALEYDAYSEGKFQKGLSAVNKALYGKVVKPLNRYLEKYNETFIRDKAGTIKKLKGAAANIQYIYASTQSDNPAIAKNAKESLAATGYSFASNFEYLNSKLGNTLSSAVEVGQEITGTSAGTKKNLARLAREGNRIVDKASKDIQDSYALNVYQSFTNTPKSKLKTVLRSLTQSLISTEAYLVLNNYSGEDTIKLLTNSGALNREIIKVQESLKGDNQDYMVKHAESLGGFLATGRHLYEGGYSNAYNISRLSHVDNTRKDVHDNEAKIDMLSTLYALKYTEQDSKKLLAEMILTEPKAIGIIAHTQESYNKKVLREAFGGYKTRMVKGRIRESYNPIVSTKIGTIAQEKDMKALGYALIKKLPKSKLDTNQTPMYLYKAKGLVKPSLRAGIISYDNSYQLNEDPFSSYNSPSNAITNEDHNNLSAHNVEHIKAKLAKVTVAQLKGKFDMVNESHTPLLPVYSNGGIIKFAYPSTLRDRVNHMGRQSAANDVIGRLQGSLIRHTNSKSINSKYVDQAYLDYTNDGALNRGTNSMKERVFKGKYVVISPNSKSVKLRKHWNSLPTAMKKDIEKTFGKKEFIIPKADLHIAVGYEEYMASNILNKLKPTKTKAMAVKSINIAERIVKDVVALMKLNIVIKTPAVLIGNVLSNIQLAVVYGANPATLIRDTVNASKYITRYDIDSKKFRDLKIQQEATPNLNEKKVLERKIQLIQRDLDANPILPLVKAGMFQKIAEDIEGSENGKGIWSTLKNTFDTVDKFDQVAGSKIPKGITRTYDVLKMEESTGIGMLAHKMTTYSDFVSRYALYNHFTKGEGLSNSEAIEKIDKAYINYDYNTNKYVQYANNIGMAMYTKFLFRIQQVILDTTKNNLGRLIALKILEKSSGMDIPDIYESFLPIKSIYTPSTGQILDSAFQFNLDNYLPIGVDI